MASRRTRGCAFRSSPPRCTATSTTRRLRTRPPWRKTSERVAAVPPAVASSRRAPSLLTKASRTPALVARMGLQSRLTSAIWRRRRQAPAFCLAMQMRARASRLRVARARSSHFSPRLITF
ncbi:hypothetical protein RI054_35g136140 [Pseudoscourfieldia marina]